MKTFTEEQISAVAELTNRRIDALSLFRAMPHQADFLRCTARECLVRGGNRCNPWYTVVFREDWSRCTLADLQVGDKIWGTDENGKVVLTEVYAKREFRDRALRLTAGEYKTDATFDHPVMVRDEECASGFRLTELSLVSPGMYVRIIEGPDEHVRWRRVDSVTDAGEQDIVGITTSTGTYIADGIAGSNSGKSTISAVRFAAIAMNKPVITQDGEKIDCRLSWQKGYQLTMWVVALGEDHIGQTIHRILFRPGLFKIIRDENTKQWRAWRPWEEADLARESEVKPSPPLIPPRYIKPKHGSETGFVWANRGKKVFDSVEIWDPVTKEDLAVIYAFTSSGDVKAGDPVDEIWIDEQIKYPSHYPEWQARLIDRRGRITWSSWPAIDNDALVVLSERAQKSEAEGTNVAREFVFTMSGNPHLDKESKADALAGWDSEDDLLARDKGEFPTGSLIMYPEFDANVHSALTDEGPNEDALSKALRANGMVPPRNWTRYLALDPGTSHPAVLLVAVPPPSIGDYIVPYKEIYPLRLGAAGLADLIRNETEGEYFYEFIIDFKAGKQTPMGFNISVESNYSKEFARCGLRSKTTGNSFSYGSTDVPGRITLLQRAMRLRPIPQLRIVTQRCPQLCKQIKSCLKDKVSGEVNDYRPRKRQTIDLLQALEYVVSRRPEWHDMPEGSPEMSASHKEYLLIQSMFPKEQDKDKSVYLGPAGER